MPILRSNPRHFFPAHCWRESPKRTELLSQNQPEREGVRHGINFLFNPSHEKSQKQKIRDRLDLAHPVVLHRRELSALVDSFASLVFTAAESLSCRCCSDHRRVLLPLIVKISLC